MFNINPYGLELTAKSAYHQLAAVNLGRNALACLLQLHRPKTLYVPTYTCPLLWQVVKDHGCVPKPYDIGEDFLPLHPLPTTAHILYTNYFGVCERQVEQMLQQYPYLWLDNAQSFFSHPQGFTAFYSPRKFFGVADGGYVYSSTLAPQLEELLQTLPRDLSAERSQYLLKALEASEAISYREFQFQEKLLAKLPLRRMSPLTHTLLESLDYATIAQRRRHNFTLWHQYLQPLNRLHLELTATAVPFAYPFLISNPQSVVQYLATQGITIFRYWPRLEELATPQSWAIHLQQHLLALPLHQGYDTTMVEHLAQGILAQQK